MMMKQQNTLEPEVKSGLFWKLKEEHHGLRDKFAQLQNENGNAAQNTTSSGKNQYDKFVGKRQEKLDGVAKYEKVSVVLKGRGEELGRLYDVGVEGFQESEEFEDLMSAIYLNGLRGGVLEARAILLALHTDIEIDEEPKQRIPHLDWTTVTLPPSHDPLMQIFMMMNQQSTSESNVKSKLFSKMKEINQVLGNRLSQLGNENENNAQNTASSSKNQYDELIHKFNIQYDEFVGKRQDNLDHAAEYEKVSGVLKGRGEELERLFNGVVLRLLKLKEFEDLMSAIYLNGLKDGILEARVILLVLHTDTN
ncbi:hypothetical protein VNO80_06200 [Phaseolus coccineus]|uniref:Uncharacterized protein n=1 Tax=Phaseolus coccineus TaxID=3886 RepID=A0AAN9RIR6_PHACN